MKRIAPVLTMHRINQWGWFIGWPIILAGFGIVLIVTLIINVSAPIIVGNLSALHVIAFISGIVSVTQLLPFALGFSLSRRDFFFGSALFHTVLYTCSAVALLLLASLEKATNWWGNRMRFFHWPWINDGTWWQQLFVIFAFLVFFHAAGFFIGSLFQRYRRQGMFTFGGGIIVLAGLLAILATYYGWWLPIGHWFARQTAVHISGWLLLVTLLQGAVAYRWLRGVGR